MFKSDLSLQFSKQELPFSVSGIVPVNFLNHAQELPRFADTHAGSNPEDDDVRYFKQCIKALPRDTCILESDKLTVLLGGQYPVHSLS